MREIYRIWLVLGFLPVVEMLVAHASVLGWHQILYIDSCEPNGSHCRLTREKMKFDLLSFHSPCRATHSTTVIILTHPRLLQITVPKGRRHTSKGKIQRKKTCRSAPKNRFKHPCSPEPPRERIPGGDFGNPSMFYLFYFTSSTCTIQAQPYE